MKISNKNMSFDISKFYNKEMLATRVVIDNIRKEALFSKESYSSLRIQKKYSDKKEKLTNRCT